MRRDLGDFQTPPELVAEVLRTLGPIGARWPRVLEPTCGQGNFIAGLHARAGPPREIHGIEIQDAHCRSARALRSLNETRTARVRITQADLFDIDLKHDIEWSEQGPLLVIGNPPWVTNSELGALVSPNRPPRRNLKGLRGLDARTGSSNFDVAEAIWLKLAAELVDQRPTIALLCKTSVARSILQFADRTRIPITSASIHRIDAGRWFRAAVDACLFRVDLGEKCAVARNGTTGESDEPNREASREPDDPVRVPVYSNLDAREPETVMGFARGWLVADRQAHARWAFADGTCPVDWRQGLKHDAARVMELTRDFNSGGWCNRNAEVIDVEAEFVYPLVKATDLTRARVDRPERSILVTQCRLGEDTSPLVYQAPRLWDYLQAHAAFFDKRKSSIYRGQPPFALFGIGPYSFAPYKVAVSGMHKAPVFRALGPIEDRPTMLDDTCYFIPCPTAVEAAVLTALCNDPITLGLIGSMSFHDSKRPITKKLLRRLDFSAVLKRTDHGLLISRVDRVLTEELSMAPDKSIPQAIERLERQFDHNIRSNPSLSDGKILQPPH